MFVQCEGKEQIFKEDGFTSGSDGIKLEARSQELILWQFVGKN